jgi:hypothetical protein
MKQADVRVDALDHFSVKLHDQAKNAMGGWMLRAEVDCIIVELFVARISASWMNCAGPASKWHSVVPVPHRYFDGSTASRGGGLARLAH